MSAPSEATMANTGLQTVIKMRPNLFFLRPHQSVWVKIFTFFIVASAWCSRTVTFYLRFECLFECLPVWDCYKNERQQRAELSWEDNNTKTSEKQRSECFGVYAIDGKSNIVNKKEAALDPDQVDKLVFLEKNASNLGPSAICQFYIYLATFLVKSKEVSELAVILPLLQ